MSELRPHWPGVVASASVLVIIVSVTALTVAILRYIN